MTTKAKPAKKAAKTAPKTAKQFNPPTKAAKPAPKVVTGHKAGTLPGDRTENGVLMPREGTQARALWAVCEALKKTLKRPPARFEFRQAIQDFTGPDDVTPVNADSSSFQYFAWRKFHGIKGRSLGLYPKRNTFEVNTPAPVKVKVPKPAKTAPAPKPAKTHLAAVAAKAAKVPTKKVAKTPAKKKATIPPPLPVKPAAKVESQASKDARAARDKARRTAKKAAKA